GRAPLLSTARVFEARAPVITTSVSALLETAPTVIAAPPTTFTLRATALLGRLRLRVLRFTVARGCFRLFTRFRWPIELGDRLARQNHRLIARRRSITLRGGSRLRILRFTRRFGSNFVAATTASPPAPSAPGTRAFRSLSTTAALRLARFGGASLAFGAEF